MKRKKTKTRFRGRKVGTVACENFADTERAKRNTKHIKERHRYGRCYAAREKAEYKRSLKTKSITSASIGIRIRRRGNAGTASWSDEGIGQQVWQYVSQESTCTAYGMAEEWQKRYEQFRWSFTRRLKQSSKENAKSEHENATSIFAGLLREGANG